VREKLAEAYRQAILAEANNDWDHLPEEQEDECFLRQIHMIWQDPKGTMVQGNVERFVELAMKVIYDDAGRAE
jgi:ABC-type dipeptide/oligopeptide/nickel transport system ATPase subunit